MAPWGGWGVVEALGFYLALLTLFLAAFYVTRGDRLGFGGSNGFGVMRFASMRFGCNGPTSSMTLRHVGRILSTRRPSIMVFANSIVCSTPTSSNVLGILRRISGHGLPFIIAFNGRSSRRKLAQARLCSVVHAIPKGLVPSQKATLSPSCILAIGSSSSPGGSTTLLCYVSDRSCSPLGSIGKCG